jgi:phage nucleotide-binding protein
LIKKRVPTKQGIEDLIKPVHELPMVLSALFYGRSGTGKTTLACTFPGPILLLDFRERGTDSVFNQKNLFVLNITEWVQVEEVYWYLRENPDKYRTVVIDQVSTMQDMCQMAVLKKEEKEQMSQRLFGDVSTKMKTQILNFRDLNDFGINVVFLAHDRQTNNEPEDDDNQIDPSIGARLMPSVAGTLNGAVKVIGNTFIRERFGPRDKETKKRDRFIDYGIRVGPHGTYTTKIRLLKGADVPDVIIDPDYQKIVDVMRTAEPTPVRRK